MPRRLTLLVLTAAALLAPAAAAPAASPDIVISQVYGGGGNSGATYTNDFIELYNRGPSAVTVDGWSVQYASASGSAWQVTNIDGTIAPGAHHLVQEAAGAGGTTPLPAPDATGTIAMSGTAGKVALLTDRTPLTCATGCVAKDLVGYGTAAARRRRRRPRASPTPRPPCATPPARDTDNNAADFTVGAPTPRNSAGPGPTVASSDPANNAAGVAPGSSLHLTFSEPVTVDPDGFALACGGDSQAVTVTQDGPATVTVDPQADLPRGTSCTLTIAADATDPPRRAGVRRVHDRRPDRAAHPRPPGRDAPLAVRRPLGHRRSRRGDGCLDQRLLDAGRAARPLGGHVGGHLRVHRRIAARPPGGRRQGQGLRPGAGVPSRGLRGHQQPHHHRNRLADGRGARHRRHPLDGDRPGRAAPAAARDRGRRRGDVELGFLFDPREDGLDFHESLEGMLVRVQRPEVVGPTNSFRELPVVAHGAATPRTARGGVVVRPDDFNPERMILDDVLKPMPDANVGDRLAGPVEATARRRRGRARGRIAPHPARGGSPTSPRAMSSHALVRPLRRLASAGGGRLRLRQLQVPRHWTPVRIDRRLRREVTQRPDRDQLAMASMNVENLSAVDDEAKFATLASIVVHNLRSPDILAVEEMQDNDGATNSGSSVANLTFERFIAAIEDAGGAHYDYRQIDPEDGEDGGEPGGNIRVGFLFRTDRGLDFVDRPGGTATNETTEDTSRPGAQLTLSPGRARPG